MATVVPPLGVDLTDPATYSNGIPHEVFAQLRAEHPVSWHPDTNVPGFWSLTRHADIVAVGRDPKSFSSARGVLLFPVPELDDPEFPRMMIEDDDPRHTRYRRLVNRGFTPRMIDRLEEFTRAVAQRTVEEARAKGSFDFVHDVSAVVPIRVIAELLGIPESDHEYVFAMSNRIIGFDDPEFADDSGGLAVEAMGEMCAYADKLGQQKRSTIDVGSAPDDIVSALLEADLDGHALSDMDFNLFVLLLSTAGNETTRTAISQGVLAFLDHPEQWDLLRANPELFGSATEEILRYTTPLFYMRRTATRDMDLGDQQIREGDRVVMWYASGNFDDTVFTEPLKFDISRNPNPHLTFGGGGPHFCLGAHLARLEIRIVFEELARQMPAIELTSPVELLQSAFANGVKRMPAKVA